MGNVVSIQHSKARRSAHVHKVLVSSVKERKKKKNNRLTGILNVLN